MDLQRTSLNGIARSLVLFRQGQDIVAPSSVLKVSAERACRKLDGVPYSIAENLAHAEHWQRHWLAKLGAAEPVSGGMSDWNWPVVAPAEWPEIRHGFLAGLDKAVEIAQLALDDRTEFVLNQILIHDTYHIGQCVLLKRLLAREVGR